jgi:hypothetical protein
MGVVNAKVEELIAILGLPTAIRLAQQFGGRRCYVPYRSHIHEDHPIARVIGHEAARKLAEEWRGLNIGVPKCLAQLRRERDRAIRAEHRAQVPVSKIAEKYGICERTVWQICAVGDEPGEPTAANAREMSR